MLLLLSYLSKLIAYCIRIYVYKNLNIRCTGMTLIRGEKQKLKTHLEYCIIYSLILTK